MRITESQLRRIVREEILREADLKGATFVMGPDGRYVPSGGMSDWEGSGARAASAMRAGRPGVTPSITSIDDAVAALEAEDPTVEPAVFQFLADMFEGSTSPGMDITLALQDAGLDLMTAAEIGEVIEMKYM